MLRTSSILRSVVAATVLTVAGIAAPAAAQHAGHDAASHAGHTAMLLDSALAGSHRSPENRARDTYRHPKETLTFFGLQPNMTAVEVSPGGGWYTEVLAPVLRDGGAYYAAHNNPAASEGAAKGVARFKEKLAAHPAVYDKVKVSSFGKDHYDSLAPAGSADMVLTFRNIHNWMAQDFAPQAFQAFFKALKPGGVLGVVEHRLPENATQDPKAGSGYVKQSEVIRMAEAAGFKLVAKSEINANPKDTADHPKGVWTLPPNYSLGEQDKAKYAAIGESDRMTLRFVKPAKSAAAKPKRKVRQAAVTGSRLGSRTMTSRSGDDTGGAGIGSASGGAVH